MIPSGNESVKWDLWMNTRMNGFDQVFAPIGETDDLKLMIEESNNHEVTPYEIINGFFTYHPSYPKKGKKEQYQEARIWPAFPYLVGKKKDRLLVIDFDLLNKDDCSPGHRQIELYSYTSEKGKSLLELETHGKYQETVPGDTLTMSIFWSIVPLEKKNMNEKEITDYIKSLKN